MRQFTLAFVVFALVSVCDIAKGDEPDLCSNAKRISSSVALQHLAKFVPVRSDPHISRYTKGKVGIVVVRSVVESDGTVSNLRILSGHPLQFGLVLDALRQWTYRPFKHQVCFVLRVPLRNDRPITEQDLIAENVARPK